jgi:hypothetical protein
MMARYTSEENNLILQLYQRGIAPSKIAARTGIRVGTIKQKLKSWCVPAQIRPATIDPAAEAYAKIDKQLPREDQFAEMLAMEFSVKRIGEVMGYKDYHSANAAFQRLRRHVGAQAR